MFTRLYTGEDGQSHFEEIDMEVGQFSWGELKTATGIMFRVACRRPTTPKFLALSGRRRPMPSRAR